MTTYWEPWFAWRPVRLMSGHWSWRKAYHEAIKHLGDADPLYDSADRIRHGRVRKRLFQTKL